jgi:hypothetical protein
MSQEDERAAMFYLSLGIVMGSLMDEKLRAGLVDGMRSGGVNPYYVRRVRDGLTAALDAAGEGAAP